MAAFILRGIYHCPAVVDEGGGGGKGATVCACVRARRVHADGGRRRWAGWVANDEKGCGGDVVSCLSNSGTLPSGARRTRFRLRAHSGGVTRRIFIYVRVCTLLLFLQADTPFSVMFGVAYVVFSLPYPRIYIFIYTRNMYTYLCTRYVYVFTCPRVSVVLPVARYPGAPTVRTGCILRSDAINVRLLNRSYRKRRHHVSTRNGFAKKLHFVGCSDDFHVR